MHSNGFFSVKPADTASSVIYQCESSLGHRLKLLWQVGSRCNPKACTACEKEYPRTPSDPERYRCQGGLSASGAGTCGEGQTGGCQKVISAVILGTRR